MAGRVLIGVDLGTSSVKGARPGEWRRCTTPSRCSTRRRWSRCAASAPVLRARPSTDDGLAGAGDLHVTGAAGRNRIFGELRGCARKTAAVVARLAARDQLTEGYAAIRWCWRFAVQHQVAGVPLLRALHRIVHGNKDVDVELRSACLGPRAGRAAPRRMP